MLLISSPEAASVLNAGAKRKKDILHEGALAQEMENRTVYDFPVAGHLCSDGAVRYIKLVRRTGQPHPQGTCAECQIAFHYQKPQRSRVRHAGGAGTTHF